jgi:hypothetical protein
MSNILQSIFKKRPRVLSSPGVPLSNKRYKSHIVSGEKTLVEANPYDSGILGNRMYGRSSHGMDGGAW